jgi:hypothetical protein
MCADLPLALKLLNYQPTTPLGVGLRSTLEQNTRIRQK